MYVENVCFVWLYQVSSSDRPIQKSAVRGFSGSAFLCDVGIVILVGYARAPRHPGRYRASGRPDLQTPGCPIGV